MRRKLSIIEHMADINIVYVVSLVGSFSLGQLRSALLRVQRKHPSLRALIRKESDGLYYEADCAPEIPLRIVPRVAEDDCRRECQAELTKVFADDQPELRAVWLQAERESDLLLTASHRICDAMSMFTIVREVLRSLYTDEELIPYAAVTTQDIIGDYQPPQLWKSKLAVRLTNGLLRLIPSSRRAPGNNEHHLEWRADRALLDALKQRCEAEDVSVHAALAATLERALFAVFGKKKFPKWIINPMDLRRGRFAGLKNDMVFSGAGTFNIRTHPPDVRFWTRARAVNDEIQREVEQEVRAIPGRFHFLERLRPLSSGQTRLLVQLSDALNFHGSWDRFGLSNLGNIVINDSDAPFRLKDLRLYLHSFNFRLIGLVPYSVNGEMHFYCVSDGKCLSPGKVDLLKREFMALLEHHIKQADDGASQVFRIPALAIAGNSSAMVTGGRS
jgi:hypothetical protein